LQLRDAFELNLQITTHGVDHVPAFIQQVNEAVEFVPRDGRAAWFRDARKAALEWPFTVEVSTLADVHVELRSKKS
jgi:hypothetical protein